MRTFGFIQNWRGRAGPTLAAMAKESSAEVRSLCEFGLDPDALGTRDNPELVAHHADVFQAFRDHFVMPDMDARLRLPEPTRVADLLAPSVKPDVWARINAILTELRRKRGE